MKNILMLSLNLFLLTVLSGQLLAQSKEEIDKRALKYYSNQEIKEMPAYKIKQINYLFTKSFIIPDEMKEKVDPAQIDINQYTRIREYDSQKKVNLINNGTVTSEADAFTEKYIILLSIKEIQQAYKDIEEGKELP
ncbi:MAG: hypothetical protein HY738_07145 [Bacteroidia bacterium]|nr:hypothetical protein [Bacteroidia bacterium]